MAGCWHGQAPFRDAAVAALPGRGSRPARQDPAQVAAYLAGFCAGASPRSPTPPPAGPHRPESAQGAGLQAAARAEGYTGAFSASTAAPRAVAAPWPRAPGRPRRVRVDLSWGRYQESGGVT